MNEEIIQKAIEAHCKATFPYPHPKKVHVFDSDCVADICRRLLASGQFISVKEVQNNLEELRVYYRNKREKHLDSNLNGLAMDDELTLKGLQMLESKLLEKGVLPESQEKEVKSQ